MENRSKVRSGGNIIWRIPEATQESSWSPLKHIWEFWNEIPKSLRWPWSQYLGDSGRNSQTDVEPIEEHLGVLERNPQKGAMALR
jgi:hypothetical protein